MKTKVIILACIVSALALAGWMDFALASDAAPIVAATCNDGTTYSGASKKGACSGHKGVKEWDAAAVPAPVAKPAVATAAVAATSAGAPVAGGGAGQVWVNSKSKVYHCEGAAFYGTTKEGAYMTEAQAKAAGNRADHGKACGK